MNAALSVEMVLEQWRSVKNMHNSAPITLVLR